MKHRQAIVRWSCCAVMLASMAATITPALGADARAEEMVTAIENLEQVKSISEFIDEYMVFER